MDSNSNFKPNLPNSEDETNPFSEAINIASELGENS